MKQPLAPVVTPCNETHDSDKQSSALAAIGDRRLEPLLLTIEGGIDWTSQMRHEQVTCQNVSMSSVLG